MLESALLLLKDNLLSHTVAVEVDIDETIQVSVIPNEFKHVILNIINNAIEAFKDNKIKGRKLTITSDISDLYYNLCITDNAGGISTNVIDNIFKPNFTTKKKGTGVGLSLSAMILSKIGATLSAQNVMNGVKFTISVKK